MTGLLHWLGLTLTLNISNILSEMKVSASGATDCSITEVVLVEAPPAWLAAQLLVQQFS